MKLWEYIACGLNVLYSNIDNIAHVKIRINIVMEVIFRLYLIKQLILHALY